MFEFQFKVGYVLYEGSDDFKIVRVSKKHLTFQNKDDEKDEMSQVSVSGVMPGVRDGDCVRGYGEWVYSKQYGWGIKAEGCSLEIPSSIDGIKHFLCRFCKGIGEQTAGKIVKQFGEDTIRVIVEDPEKLLDVPRITQKKMNTIHKAVLKHRAMEDLSVFLFSHGCSSYNEVLSIYQKMGARALDKIMTNPYSICREVNASKFPLADKIALSSGYDPNGKERVKNIVIFFLKYKEENHGDMFAYMKQLPNQIIKYMQMVGVSSSGILYQSEEFMTCLLELQKEGFIVLLEEEDDYCVFLKKNYDCEMDTTRAIASMCFKTKPVECSFFDNFVKEFEGVNQITFTEKQKEAMLKAVMYRFSTITGGAGTGKTETIRGILACIAYKDKGAKIVLVSPTGRASKRMTEVTGQPAITIHRFLKITPDNPEGSFEDIEDIDYVICDESSMISASLFRLLLMAVSKTKAHLILVGDVNQLAPVGAGLPFKDVLSSNVAPCTVLSTLFRQEEQSLINVNANKVLAGDTELSFLPNRTDFNFFPLANQDEIKQVMLKCFDNIIQNMNFSPNDIIVLSSMNKTLLGVVELNNFLQPYFNAQGIRKGNSFRSRGYTIYEGDRVMQISNNYDLGVFNGDIGYVTCIDKDAGEIIVSYDDYEDFTVVNGKTVPGKKDVIYYTDDSFEQDLVLAYACTVHKAQGCEFPVVFMPVHEMLVNISRTLIYTALTRARSCFAFLGNYSALQQGIIKDEILRRNTRLCQHLQSAYMELQKGSE